jgi:hypothetical protein
MRAAATEFDPAMPAMVHDQLNEEMFEWYPEKWRVPRRYAAAV